ncbi:MAG: 4-(cytidine 5'-diphospho)-2-C-methyl-D-erythritol kinase [Halomonadaceae bacterium]|nr:MAG: 4-(cytidine 5'-diphospho)-2-C-methyl-D-erythritol kinase [Halomonadaceae bacterium]
MYQAASLTLPAPAKLNLFLHITGRRPDGYHELQTLFQFLNYWDLLTFSPRQDGIISLSGMPGTGAATVADADNLITRAARLLQPFAPAGAGVDIVIQKQLPMGGGLGGGSSNAATTLLGLNHLWGCHLGPEALATMGLALGADVPVFIHGRAAWAEGVGERLTPVSPPEDWFVVLVPDCHCNTGEVFRHQGLTRDTPKSRIRTAFEGNLNAFKNDCEPVVRDMYPPVAQALDWLNKRTTAQLTGTGSCVFGRVSTQSAAQRVLTERPSGIEGFIAQGMNRSPLLTRLSELY